MYSRNFSNYGYFIIIIISITIIVLAHNNQDNNLVFTLQKTFTCTSLFEYYVYTERMLG